GFGEDADDLTGLQLFESLAVGGQARGAVDGDVVHPAHERPGDPVVEDLLLRHEPRQPLGRARAEAAEDEVQVAHVVARDDRTAVARDVLRALDPDAVVQYPEHRPGRRDHGRVNRAAIRPGYGTGGCSRRV